MTIYIAKRNIDDTIAEVYQPDLNDLNSIIGEHNADFLSSQDNLSKLFETDLVARIVSMFPIALSKNTSIESYSRDFKGDVSDDSHVVIITPTHYNSPDYSLSINSGIIINKNSTYNELPISLSLDIYSKRGTFSFFSKTHPLDEAKLLRIDTITSTCEGLFEPLNTSSNCIYIKHHDNVEKFVNVDKKLSSDIAKQYSVASPVFSKLCAGLNTFNKELVEPQLASTIAYDFVRA